MLGLPRFPRSKPAIKVTTDKVEPAPRVWADRAGVEWRVFRDSTSDGMRGEWMTASHAGTTVRVFVPDYPDDYAVWRDAARAELVRTLTPLERYLLTGSAFE